MPDEARLLPTQLWLQQHIVAPELDDAGANLESERRIKPSGTLTARERADIYRGMYLLRMEEALASDYPVLRDVLGEEDFAALVAGYVTMHPSRSHTLNRLGDHLPSYLESRDPFQHALATFELAVTEAFDAEQSDVLSAADVMVIPPDSYADVVLQAIPALRLLRVRYPVHRFKQAYRDDESYPAPELDATQIVVYRRDYQVLWCVVTKPAYELLRSLVQGERLGAAVEGACLTGGVDEAQLFAWFQEWVSNGFFQAARISPEADPGK